MKKIVELDPSNDQARRSILRLQPLADEKKEKMKEEMIGKLIASSSHAVYALSSFKGQNLIFL